MDNWRHRSVKMRCETCMWWMRKARIEPMREDQPWPGRCRRHAPMLGGFPVTFDTDWCGDHKLDENAC